ncbi:hypothetical protein Nepgr_026490 [Nepenthes gracilis]|uniref:Uncharacterized protein n=1 Tax=Nepenthes gracilis TaxID=150966 RepID=A0AAD3T9T4_NEPGR|nr:hypothetical protein Nepgr_026490 [Nepenthes gracilis]
MPSAVPGVKHGTGRWDPCKVPLNAFRLGRGKKLGLLENPTMDLIVVVLHLGCSGQSCCGSSSIQATTPCSWVKRGLCASLSTVPQAGRRYPV